MGFMNMIYGEVSYDVKATLASEQPSGNWYIMIRVKNTNRYKMMLKKEQISKS